MTSVLVGVDGSDDSRTAVRWAAIVADALRVPLRALWVWQYPNDAVLTVGAIDLPNPDRTDEHVEAQLRQLLAEVLGDDRAAGVSAEVARGPASAALLRAAEEGPRMVVVGSRGLGGFKGLLLGSVSRQLFEHAPCPVTVVRHAAPVPPRRLETVVVGTDGSPDAERALRFAAEVAAKAGAELVVAHATAPAEVVSRRGISPYVDLEERRAVVEGWCSPLREAGVAYEVEVVRGDARTALLDLARDRVADLLVVGSRGRGPVGRLLVGSVASSLTQHSELPVTVVPDPLR
jgi:nucleotide-binding universal stress UspA family protein